MMHTHSLGRAARYYPERAALGSGGRHSTFRQLHGRIAGIVAALNRHGFERGDRLALLLPNGPEHLELVYACSWLGVVAVPVNTRFSVVEIDRVLADANPRGLIRHSSLPAPTVKLSRGSRCSMKSHWTLRSSSVAIQFTTADELIVHCRRFLANYKIPRRVEFSETDLPKSGSGKILKRALRERFWVDQKRAVG